MPPSSPGPARPKSPPGHSTAPDLRGASGAGLLYDPRLNKSTAFTEVERDALGLRGLLPPRVLTLREQLVRIRRNFDSKGSDIEKYIFLVSLQDRNETLFFRFVVDHLAEMLPIIYTPTVGEACRTFGHIFRRPRGLYLSIRDRSRLRPILDNWPERDVSVIVTTDGERILGLGDLGAHGMGIPIGKLALYTACAGVHPARCLPIMLDVGTDNEELLADPLYTGLLRPRLRGAEYDEFLEEFVSAAEDKFPGVLLQWEDFATQNAIRLLDRYRGRLCTFNDDIQGTAAVTLAALLSACRAAEVPLLEQRILFFGAGASATGVATLIASAMQRLGLSPSEARSRIGIMDSKGLVVASRRDLAEHKRPWALERDAVPDLAGAISALRPTALIGLSTQPGAFSEPVVREMAARNRRPVIFALSNPTSRAECTAEQAWRWTDGRVLFASGSPFEPVAVGGGRLWRPSQANNAYIFPGLGLGIVLSGARRVPDAMFHTAAKVVAGFLPGDDLQGGVLLPPIEAIRAVSARIAAAVARLAVEEGLATRPVPDPVEPWAAASMYDPEYRAYV